MQFTIRVLLVFVVAVFLLPQSSTASVVFKPGQKPQYVGPGGEEEMNGDAAELFQVGQTAEKEGDYKRAIRAYKSLVRRHPREAIEAQFRIGEIYLKGKKLRFLGVPIASALDRAVTIFANVVRTAPYGKYTARAQFDIGLAREKQGANDAAIQAYQAVVDKFPNEPVAVDAQYQIGYIWFTAAQLGTKDAAAAANAKTGFEDFLLHYPKSEKAAQARANLDILEHKQTANSYKVAKFYDKQKYYRAAVIYYNEVIRQQPGSQESNEAKKRIDQLRAKFGDAALQPALPVGQAGKKKSDMRGARTAETGTAKPGQPNNEAPLPASESDNSLPPPASLAPDTTTAPDLLMAPPGTSTSSAPSPPPEASASPGASASPAP
ncbi:MAG: hypothetical protein DMF20_05640 [Verrucomicrobia bacterium]|nr:MAG: hypothetical protein DMF20_05640 [Verrucomicrobiota bacterium]